MKRYFILYAVFLLLGVSGPAHAIGGMVLAGNSMIDAAKGIKQKMDTPIQVIELDSGEKIDVFVGDKAYFVDENGNKTRVPDGQYRDKTGADHSFRGGMMER